MACGRTIVITRERKKSRTTTTNCLLIPVPQKKGGEPERWERGKKAFLSPYHFFAPPKYGRGLTATIPREHSKCNLAVLSTLFPPSAVHHAQIAARRRRRKRESPAFGRPLPPLIPKPLMKIARGGGKRDTQGTGFPLARREPPLTPLFHSAKFLGPFPSRPLSPTVTRREVKGNGGGSGLASWMPHLKSHSPSFALPPRDEIDKGLSGKPFSVNLETPPVLLLLREKKILPPPIVKSQPRKSSVGGNYHRCRLSHLLLSPSVFARHKRRRQFRSRDRYISLPSFGLPVGRKGDSGFGVRGLDGEGGPFKSLLRRKRGGGEEIWAWNSRLIPSAPWNPLEVNMFSFFQYHSKPAQKWEIGFMGRGFCIEAGERRQCLQRKINQRGVLPQLISGERIVSRPVVNY